MIKELPESERPYDRCDQYGPEVLSDSELLAVILRCGASGSNSLDMCKEILNAITSPMAPGLCGLLHCSSKELMSIRGIGKVKALQLLCIGELSKRITATYAKQSLRMTSPKSIADYMMEKLRHEEQENFIVLIFDNKNQLVKELLVTKGTVNAVLVTPREVFIQVLRFQGVRIVLVHNHPSGDPTPSKEDIEITNQFYESGNILGVSVLDHLIIGAGCYYSFIEQGLLCY